MRSTSPCRWALAITLALTAAGLHAASAQATLVTANVTYSGDATFKIATDPGVANDISVSMYDGRFVVTDVNDPVYAIGYGCERWWWEHSVRCGPSHHYPRIDVELGDGDDRFEMSPALMTKTWVQGGAGDDTIRGGDADDMLQGGSGRDVLSGQGGFDSLNGGPGPRDDATETDAGDILSGGLGRDQADFDHYRTKITVRLDDWADDGASGEDDNVRSDVEQVRGTVWDDTLVGNEHANVLYGGYGNDSLVGRDGLDHLAAGAGADRLDSRDSDGRADAVVDCGDGVDTAAPDARDPLWSCEYRR